MKDIKWPLAEEKKSPLWQMKKHVQYNTSLRLDTIEHVSPSIKSIQLFQSKQAPIS